MTRSRRLLAPVFLLTVLAVSATALAAATKHQSQTFTIAAHATRTVNVPYPDALKFANARYSGRVTVLGSGAHHVKVLSSGPALGGSEFRARIANHNGFAVHVKVTATTTRR